MSNMRIAILKALTSVLSSLARWASSHPVAIVNFALMIVAGAVVLMGSALVYLIIWLI